MYVGSTPTMPLPLFTGSIMRPSEVKIIAHSRSTIPGCPDLITYQLRYWRGFHSELMTHRVFSRNAGSSRARPTKAIIDQVRTDPWGPLHWGSNKPGMQAGEELTGTDLDYAKEMWLLAAHKAAGMAERMMDLGLHKQVINRVLEPFTFIDVVVTSTEWNNWFALRDHPAAQPEIQELAKAMRAAKDASIPQILTPGEYHLPYISDEDYQAAERFCQIGRITRDMPSKREILEVLLKISVARCARVSYKAFDGNPSPIEKDIELYNQLLGSQPMHASPAEHQATPMHTVTMIAPDYASYEEPFAQDKEFEFFGYPDSWSNLRGWLQYRKTLPNEYIPG